MEHLYCLSLKLNILNKISSLIQNFKNSETKNHIKNFKS